ncbi:MAG: T9SS type A sorting domain-containing protein [Bacteroidales bacterium]
MKTMKRFMFVLAVFTAFSLNSIGQIGWTMVDSDLPAGIGVGQLSIGMNDNTAIWGMAINSDGSINDSFTRSVDGGNTWVGGTFNAGTGLSQLFAFDADVCWAVFNTGATQGLYKTTDGGATWVKKGGVYGATSFANVIHFFNDMDGFAQGDPVGVNMNYTLLLMVVKPGLRLMVQTYQIQHLVNIGNYIGYDNAVVDFYTELGPDGTGGILGSAVVFTIEDPSQLVYALIRNYTDQSVGPNDEMVVHVWGDSGNGPGDDLIDPITIMPEANLVNTRAFTRVDLRPYASQLTGILGDIFVGFTVPSGVVRTTITQPGNANRSFQSVDGIAWSSITDDYHYRIVTGEPGVNPWPPAQNVTATVENLVNVHVDWDAPAGAGDLIELWQHDGTFSNAYYQAYDYGYGVVYDLSGYSDVTIEYCDFRHSSWGINGTWDYKIHIVDWDTYTELAVVGPLQSTGNDQWEEGIVLGSIPESGMVGIFLEPMSNDPADAYPCLDGDNALDGMSYFGALSDYSAMGLAETVGDFLIDLWIMAGSDNVVVKPPKVQVANTGNGNARMPSNPLTVTEYTLNQNASSNASKSVLEGYNVFRNGDEIAYVAAPTTEYDDMNLDPGVYEYCISAVYDDGESFQECADEVTIESNNPPAPMNLEGMVGGNGIDLTWEGLEGGWIQWDAGVNNGNGIGATGGGTFDVASHWAPADLTPYNGFSLTKVNFYANGDPNATYTIKVWTGVNGNTLAHTQPVATFVVDDWNEVELTTPVEISSAVDFWFGYEVTHGADMFPAGCDDGPAVQYKGDMIALGSSWVSMSVEYGLDYNWNIAGFVEAVDGKTSPMTPVEEIVPYTAGSFVSSIESGMPTQPANKFNPTSAKDLTYNVYFKPEGGSYSEIANTAVTNYTHTSPVIGWNYYYVTTLLNGNESDPSNEVSILFTSIEDIVSFSTQVYPNPASNLVNIKSDFEIKNITVYNYAGQVITKEQVDNYTYQFNTSEFNPGIYFFQIETTDGTTSKRIIVE